MAYIGNEPGLTNFIFGLDRFNGTGACTQFTLTRTTDDANTLEILVNSVQQDPINSYSVSGGVVTFTAAPSVGSNNIVVIYRSSAIISYNNVTTAQIIDGAITSSKLATSISNNSTIAWNTANAASLTANTPTHVANSAASYANSAFTRANNSVTSANGTIAWNTANAAFTNANGTIAWSTANSAASYANSAFATANSASIYANAAFTSSNTKATIASPSFTGNVGIGTASANAALHVAGPIEGFPTGNGVSLGSGSGGYGRITLIGPSGGFIDFSTPGVNFKGRILCANSDNAMAFYTEATERMRLTSDGNLYVGTTSPVAGAKVAVNWNSFNQHGLIFRTLSATYNASPVIFLNSVGGSVGDISQSESIVSYNSASDYRLKENVAPMTGSLAKVAALKPVTYTWKIDGSAGQGFIAHELQEVIPDCVTGTKDAVDKDGKPKHQGVDTSFLVATLTAAIQEQQVLIQDLTSRLTVLEAK